MVITYHGLEFFKVQFGSTVVAFNPPAAESMHKSARFGADVVLTSLNQPDFTGGSLLSAGGKEPFIINGPGEYEVSDVFIRGFPSISNYGGTEQINTIYLVTLEEMSICFLGALGSRELEPKTAEALDDIDILFVPIGGEGVLDPSDAYKFAVKLEPAIIIPMHYEDGNGALKSFLKEEGSEAVKPVDKLTIKRKDISHDNSIIQVLSKS
jgi:hypothetical protein